MKDKSDLYTWIKLTGLISSIPIILISGPLAGYIAGSFLEERFHTHYYLTVFFVLVGMAASMGETWSIIKKLISIDKKNPNGQ